MNELVFLALIQTLCGPAAPLRADELLTYEACRSNVVTCIAINRGSAQQCAGKKYRQWLRDKTKALGEL